MRILVGTLRKLIRRPATVVTFLLLNVFTLLIFVLGGVSARQSQDPEAQIALRALFTFPGAYRVVLAFVLMNGLIVAAYAAAVAGSEWSWGTLKAAVARGESRTRYVVGTFAGVAIAMMLMALGAFILGIPIAILGAVLGGFSLDGVGDTSWRADLPDLLWRGMLAFSMEGALGFAIATVTRSQIAGIGVVIGLNIAEGIGSALIHDVFKYFPFTAANALISGGAGGPTFGGGAAPRRMDTPEALALTTFWLVAALVFASVWTERAEITG
jgi:ABC-2 type transport system permease protein